MFVRLWMTENPITAAPTDTVADALLKMETGNFRRLPVLDGKALTGIVNLPMLREAMAEEKGSAPLSSVMTQNPMTVDVDDPLEEVANGMRENKIGSYPVLKKGKLVGLITESDVFNALLHIMGHHLPGTRITMDLERKAGDMRDLLEMIRAYNLEILSIVTYEIDESKRTMVNLRLHGNRIEKFVDALWKKKFRILKVTAEKKEE